MWQQIGGSAAWWQSGDGRFIKLNSLFATGAQHKAKESRVPLRCR